MAGNKRPLSGQNSNGFNPALGTPKLDAFGNARPHPFDAVSPSSPEEDYSFKTAYDSPTPTLLPRHLYAPEGARTVNAIRIISVPSGAAFVNLFDFPCIDGSTTVITAYGLFTTAAHLADIEWRPTINENRVLAYHGDPANNYRLTEATGLSLANTDLVSCQLLMETGQVLNWSVRNTSGAAVQMGVRIVGYIDMSQRLMSSKFGD